MIYSAQCPHCHEKLHWGKAAGEERAVPDRCTYCYEPLEQAIMTRNADLSIAESSFNLPAEG